MNKRGFGVVEVIVGITVFSILIIYVSQSFNFSLANYKEGIRENAHKNIILDIYANLYSYKKAYGTIDFITYITNGNIEANCNGNYPSNPAIKDYCFFYPYSNSGTISFYKGNISNINSSLAEIYLLDNNNNGNDSSSYLKWFDLNNYNETIIIGLKQDFSDSDLFTGFIGIYDLGEHKFLNKENINLK